MAGVPLFGHLLRRQLARRAVAVVAGEQRWQDAALLQVLPQRPMYLWLLN